MQTFAAVPTARTATGSSVDPSALLSLLDADLDALADRLHDGVLQSLVVARYACDAVARGADPSVARDAVQEALVALRRDVWALRPRTHHGLAAALTELASRRAVDGRPALDLMLDDDDDDIDPAAAAVAYRLVQSVPDDRPLTVRLSGAALDVGAGVDDPAAWALRLSAVGAVLLSESARTRVLLPPRSPHDTSSDDRKHP